MFQSSTWYPPYVPQGVCTVPQHPLPTPGRHLSLRLRGSQACSSTPGHPPGPRKCRNTSPGDHRPTPHTQSHWARGQDKPCVSSRDRLELMVCSGLVWTHGCHPGHLAERREVQQEFGHLTYLRGRYMFASATMSSASPGDAGDISLTGGSHRVVPRDRRDAHGAALVNTMAPQAPMTPRSAPYCAAPAALQPRKHGISPIPGELAR